MDLWILNIQGAGEDFKGHWLQSILPSLYPLWTWRAHINGARITVRFLTLVSTWQRS